MTHLHQRRARAVAASLGVALFASFLTPVAAHAAEPAKLVINEVYMKGGSASAPFKDKFVELYNAGGTAQTLDGWSLQYRSATGTSTANGSVGLSGTVQPGSYFLVSIKGNGTTGAALPTPDFDAGTALSPSGTTGTLYLARTSTRLSPATGSIVGDSSIVDLIGYGTSNTFERAAASVVGANSEPNSLTRTGFVDTDDNAADFTSSVTVTPQNASSTPVPQPSATSTPTPSPTTAPTPSPSPSLTVTPTNSPSPSPAADVMTIADIQGASDVSPRAGQTVTTTGVVTAAFPTGGFDGFYIQTPGTGGAIDLTTHTASDGLFVYGLAATKAVAVGDRVEVRGAVSEFNGLTELTAPSAAAVKILASGDTSVVPGTVGLPRTDSERESLEGMLLAPAGDFTVSNTYSTNQYGEVGLASGTTPLVTPTDVARPRTAEYDAVVADNAARAVTLDDGASINFLGSTANKAIPLPYLSDAPVTVGSRVAFTKPVVLDFRNKTWKFQPTATLNAGDAAALSATFSDVRPSAPAEVGGDVQIASFNVLNYFTTTGVDYARGGISCTYYTDRAGAPITVKDCSTGQGPRGAANAENLARRQDKIVSAITGLGAEVVSLEEIENSVKFGKDRDSALSTLVSALNVAAGSDVWAFVPSPSADQLPPVAQQDVIRTAFIYKKAAVAPLGAPSVLIDPAFANARQPLAQTFARPGGTRAQFVAIVNHFKSKGSGDGANSDQGDGQGASNASRVDQARALVKFADGLKASQGTSKVFLLGDFNSYTREDPMQVFADAGYTNLAPAGEYTYSFSGQSGSLDHVLASPEARTQVTGAHVWNINAGESIAREYSRYNYNATNFYRGDAFRASDHDPLVVGVNLQKTVDLTLLNINDFHGRIDANTVKFAGTVEQLRAAGGEGNTLFLSDGDNIGASLFASALDGDAPTIDVLNALDLKASAVGNHEFDKGFADLTGRVDERAAFDYLGANVYRKGTQEPALPEYATFEAAGLTVGIIGAVTQETPTLVSPGGVANLDFGDPVDAVNRVAAQLTDGDPSNGEADVLVAEFHEGAGAGTPEKATLEQEIAAGGPFARIVTATSPTVSAIFTGHTHKQYAWDGPLPGTTQTRPVLQTGNYGENIGQVVLTLDADSGALASYTAKNVARTTTADATLVSTYPGVATVKGIVDAALAKANTVGSQQVGTVSGDITTSFSGGSYVDGRYTPTFVNGVPQGRDNRAGQSTLGNLVADSLVSTLQDDSVGGAEIGVVNPGGLRNELYNGSDGGVVTYAEANAVLPFVNNLWTTSLTGAKFVEALEQQWQLDASGKVPSRPYLQLGLSSNVRYTYDSSATQGHRITGVWIDGQPLDPARQYRVGSFSFLLQGGDNFRAFAQGAGTRDSGLIDRDAWIAYLQNHNPVGPDFASRRAEVVGAPTGPVTVGDTVTFRVGGVDLTSLGAPRNTTFDVSLKDTATPLPGATAVEGVATISVTIPRGTPSQTAVVVTARESGTVVEVPLEVRGTPVLVYYDRNGATGGAKPATGSYSSGGEAYVVAAPGTLVRSGYRFSGWNTRADGTGEAYVPGDRLTPTRQTELFAQWTGAPRTIAYTGNGSTGGLRPASGSWTPGDAPYIVAVNRYVRAGYAFTGWNTRADGTGDAYAPGASLEPTGDIRLYAQWAVAPRAVTYVGNGSTGGRRPAAGTWTPGSPAYRAADNTYVRTGYAFAGWNTKADGTGETYLPGASLEPATDVRLYAQWQQR